MSVVPGSLCCALLYLLLAVPAALPNDDSLQFWLTSAQLTSVTDAYFDEDQSNATASDNKVNGTENISFRPPRLASEAVVVEEQQLDDTPKSQQQRLSVRIPSLTDVVHSNAGNAHVIPLFRRFYLSIKTPRKRTRIVDDEELIERWSTLSCPPTVVVDKILIGLAEKLIISRSFEQCYVECLRLNAIDNTTHNWFPCRSGVFIGDSDLNCILNSENRLTQPRLFVDFIDPVIGQIKYFEPCET